MQYPQMLRPAGISNSFLKTENNEVLDCIQRPDEVIYVPEGLVRWSLMSVLV